jgi:hypothetical protein
MGAYLSLAASQWYPRSRFGRNFIELPDPSGGGILLANGYFKSGSAFC